MDAARYARMSDPDCNPAFRRRWSDPDFPPPIEVEDPPTTLEETGLDLLMAWRRELQQRPALNATRPAR